MELRNPTSLGLLKVAYRQLWIADPVAFARPDNWAERMKLGPPLTTILMI